MIMYLTIAALICIVILRMVVEFRQKRHKDKTNSN